MWTKRSACSNQNAREHFWCGAYGAPCIRFLVPARALMVSSKQARESGKSSPGKKSTKASASSATTDSSLVWKQQRAAQAMAFKPRSGAQMTNEQRKVATDAFFAIDVDGSGYIDSEEIRQFFNLLGVRVKLLGTADFGDKKPFAAKSKE